MAFEIDLDECIGCGACEAACPAEAITQVESFAVSYRVDLLRCNDCARCLNLCPVEGFAVAEGWAVCHGRGCPLTAARYAGVECSEGQTTCGDCGSVLWRRPGQAFECAACAAAAEGRSVAGCPKTRKAARLGARA